MSQLTDVVDVEAGYEHTCAVKKDATVWCWGRGSEHRLGNGSTSNRYTPVVVQDIDDAKLTDQGAMALYRLPDPFSGEVTLAEDQEGCDRF